MSRYARFTTEMLTAFSNLFASRIAGGSIGIYDGTKPASSNTAVTTQVLCVSFAIPSPAGDVADGTLTGATIAPAMVSAAGTHTAIWARIYDADDVAIADYDVGLASDPNSNDPDLGFAILLDSLLMIEGSYVNIVSMTQG